MRIKSGATLKSQTAVEQTFEYHEKTKHRLEKYADGPEFLDWDLQPNPYRYFDGLEQISLSLDLKNIIAGYQTFYTEKKPDSLPLSKENIGIFLGLSMGLSAHKEYMGDQWSVRCNPSSGNLHPTEAYLISSQINGLQDGVYHYLSENHSLQQRMVSNQDSPLPTPLIALTSIHWREAWKYGERAFRYCQLDVGHALAAMAYAARCLGWQLNILNQWSSRQIATLCGVNRDSDYANVEREYADVVLSITTIEEKTTFIDQNQILPWISTGQWQGLANKLDKHPMYRWPAIFQVEDATEIFPVEKPKSTRNLPDILPQSNNMLAKHLIFGRRSAQRFDKQTGISRQELYTLLDKCLLRPDMPPWSTLSEIFPMYMIFYVHRVTSLTPGLYMLANTEADVDAMKENLDENYLWTKPLACPQHIPFYLLSNKNMEKFSRTVSCHQAIAADGVFSLSMLFQFEKTISEHPMNYRKMHWQAGALGQLLYLEAESLGLQGTGIGCFFDDAIHNTLGLKDRQYQVLYNFTMGAALNDPRISTLPAYSHLEMNL